MERAATETVHVVPCGELFVPGLIDESDERIRIEPKMLTAIRYAKPSPVVALVMRGSNEPPFLTGILCRRKRLAARAIRFFAGATAARADLLIDARARRWRARWKVFRCHLQPPIVGRCTRLGHGNNSWGFQGQSEKKIARYRVCNTCVQSRKAWLITY